MKRSLFIALVWCLFFTPLHGEEYKSSFGFTIEVPEQWTILTAKELKNNSDLFSYDKKEFRSIDEGLLKSVITEVQSGQIEFYFNKNTSNSIFTDNINVRKQVGKIPENTSQLRELCDSLPEELSSYFGKNTKVHRCFLKEINGFHSLLLEFDGVVQGTTSVQYQIQKSPNVQIIITATCKNTSLDIIRQEFESILSSIKMK